MERIKNFISPRARRKKLELSGLVGAGDGNARGVTCRIFGVPLEQLVARLSPGVSQDGPRVPFVVRRLCEYIHKHGLDNVGLFRVSGSVRVVERLRMQFELTGDADLEVENDVAATAGLLRVFLRDLPDTLVSERLTPRFFSIVQGGGFDKGSIVDELKKALDLLPEESYSVLKYIVSLLVVVADNEAENKMSAYSLAILFGPNVFRYELTSGVEGLRDMDSSKELMELFISHYDELFAEKGEPSPQQFWDKTPKRKTPPPRPPPPKVHSMPTFKSHSLDSTDAPPMPTLTSSLSVSSSALDRRPVPSPRKIKNVLENSQSMDFDGLETPTMTLNSGSCVPLFSPREDMDINRAPSPFTLESETHSIIESPMVTARTHEFVEKTIVQTISEHIFGSMDFNQNSGPHCPGSPKSVTHIDNMVGSPVDLPIAKPRQTLATKSGVTSPDPYTQESSNPDIATRSAQPSVNGESEKNSNRSSPTPDFDDVERTDIILGHKKPTGPLRRAPSRKHRLHLSHAGPSDEDASASLSTSANSAVSGNGDLNFSTANAFNKSNEQVHTRLEHEEVSDTRASVSNHYSPQNGDAIDDNSPQARVVSPLGSGLKTTSAWEAEQESADNNAAITPPGLSERFSTNTIKLFIPPLDFSTLHEQVDTNEPISVTKAQFDSQIWIKTNQLGGVDDTNVAVISPRSNKLKKDDEELIGVILEAPMSPSANSPSGQFRASTNTDIPPSPPIQQDIYQTRSDDDCSHRLRQLTKKISGLKKKIKGFEESFELQHGYKPSQGEKAAQSFVKKYMTELSKARKDLKRLKENTEKGNRSRHNSEASSSGVDPSPPATPSVSSTHEFIHRCLLDKRREAGRPEELVLMTRDQVMEEKLAVQRALLHFEGLHGRPSTKEEKDLMRPLYDRYRSVKRMLAKPQSPRNSLELQTVPEDQMIEIPRHFTQRNAIRIPTAEESEREDVVESWDGGTHVAGGGIGGGEFGLVTQDLGLLRELEEAQLDDGEAEGEGIQSSRPGSEDSGGGEANLHEMSVTELHAELEVSRKDKKRLRRILKSFEEEFFDLNGRKVQKEDRHPLQTEYSQYKKVKARLRLLEALVLKHHD